MATAKRGRNRRQVIGQRGEDVAVEYLSGAGWSVLERNWRCRYGEIDVIAVDGADLVIVEVKTRTGSLYADPAEAVTYEKYRRLRRLAGLWLAEQERGWPVIRFDVIAVQIDSAGTPDVRHLRGVF
ncbi:YraN family protein [Williamsia sp.]|uniref:YraN family protein n=1 Tax=Williamsia sp. TaxID=1872085 RepID=UPI001A20760C|nr:YraN family protein [Williamsia sp.]MBJ7287445.1 YraN family protein [Williamsia sp.]